MYANFARWKAYSQLLPLHSKRERKNLTNVFKLSEAYSQRLPFHSRPDLFIFATTICHKAERQQLVKTLCYNMPSNNWWPIIMHVVFFSHIFNSSTETNKPMELVFKMNLFTTSLARAHVTSNVDK